MNTPKIVSDYLDAAVPKGLTASRRKLITQELESHIFDKAEHYIEIGYSEEESFEKAVAEMGGAEAVNESFEKVYRESRFKAAATFIGITAANLLSVLLGFGFSILYFAGNTNSGSEFYFESYIFSTLAVYFIFISILSAYKNGNRLKLKAIGFANLLMSLTPGFFNNLYQPFIAVWFYTFGSVLKLDLTDSSDATVLLYLIGGEVISIFFCVLSLRLSTKRKTASLSEEKEAKTNKFRKITAAVLAPVLVLTLTVFVSLCIKNDEGYDFAIGQIIYSVRSGNQSSSAAAIYDSLNDSMSFTQVDKKLKNAGYIPNTEISKAVKDKVEIECTLDGLKRNYEFNAKKEIAYFKNFREDYLGYGNVIIIDKSGAETLNYKKHINPTDRYAKDSGSFFVFRHASPENCQKAFEKLKIGQDKKSADRKISPVCGSGVDWIETKYRNADVLETWHYTEMFSYSGLFEYDNRYAYVDLVFKNGFLISGKYTLDVYYEEYDETVDKHIDKEKHTVITLPRQAETESTG